jgi:parallel beta-helix repeat protein
LGMKTFGAACAMVLVCAMCGSAATLRKELLSQPWYPKAPPLPKPDPEKSQVLKAASVREIYNAAKALKEGGTIMVADGHYMMTHSLYIKKSNATLRSESGDRTKVILDFKKSRHGEGVCISYAKGVTVADLTVQNVSQNGIKINSNHGVSHVTIYNVISHNVWQRHIKGVGVPYKDGKQQWVDDCRIQYCLFYNDRPKRRGDDPWEDGKRGGRMKYNYIGGMDIMGANGWVISDNVFTGIRGATGECRGAIFMWNGSKNCIIERNVFIDNDTGICLGNSSNRKKERRHATGFIVRNNFITRCPESNILADHTRDCTIVNNTVHDPKSRMRRLIRVVHDNDGLVVKNNIFSGPGVSISKYPPGKITVENNLVKDVADYFVDADKGNLHLTDKAVEAIDKATKHDKVTADIDGKPRGDKPDLGADEK